MPQTKQDVFNKVALHLLAQNKRSIVDDDGMCRYRGPEGTTCAVGCLIDDESYLPEMEGYDVVDIFGIPSRHEISPELSMVRERFSGHDLTEHLALLDALQRCHDRIPVEDWHAELVDIAREQGLNSDVLPPTPASSQSASL